MTARRPSAGPRPRHEGADGRAGEEDPGRRSAGGSDAGDASGGGGRSGSGPGRADAAADGDGERGAGSGDVSLGGADADGDGKLRHTLTRIRRVLAGVPAFGKLLYRLLGDGRVSLLDRVIFAAALAYLFVPVDLVPDWIPALGQMDDILIVVFTVDRLLHRTDEAVLAEHWDGDPASFRALVDLLERAVDVLPRWARALLRAGR